MTSSTNNPTKAKVTRTKAILAIAFAGNVFTAQLPASCNELPDGPSSSAIELMATSGRVSPEERAYYLLTLADCYIKSGKTDALENQFKTRALSTSGSFQLFTSRRGLPILVLWANNAAFAGHSAGTVAHNQGGKYNVSAEKRALADKAIAAAITQLDLTSKNAEKLNLYLIASGLSRITGNTINEQKCAKVLSQAIQACESSETADSAQIKVIASILNTMAYGLIPIQISDTQVFPSAQPPAVDKKNFDESERLKLRATAMLDRLPNSDQERRKAHRDLTLWYQQLGKTDKALKEKQELFKLVGVKDDNILYPQAGGCGHVVWWTLEKKTETMDCGMG